MTTGSDDAAVFTRSSTRTATPSTPTSWVASPTQSWPGTWSQETFLRAWRRLSEVGPLPADPQRAWLFTVARNLVIDSYRAGATRQATEASLRHDAATRATAVPGPHLEAEYGERLAQLRGRDPRAARGAARDPLDGNCRRADQPRDRRGPGRAGRTVRYRLGQARKQLAAALDLEEDR